MIVGRQLTNFDGLEGFHALVESATLRVSVPSREPTVVEGGQRLIVGDDEFAVTTITLKLPWDEGTIELACREAGLAVEEVSLVAIAEDSMLKERSKLLEVPLGGCASSYLLADDGKARPRALLNRRERCTIWFHLVLNQRKEPTPGRPHRLGTKLASTSFVIRSDGAGLGFDPKPLDAATAQRLGIPSTTLIFLEVKDDLATSRSLDGAIEVYIKQSVFDLLARDQVSKEVRAIAEGLAHDAARQLVYLTSRSLQGETVDLEAAAVTLVHSWMKEAKLGVEVEEAVEMIESRPEFVAGWLSSGRAASNLELILREFDEEEGR